VSVRKARPADHRALPGLIREYERFAGRFDAKTIAPALRELLRDESLGCAWMNGWKVTACWFRRRDPRKSTG